MQNIKNRRLVKSICEESYLTASAAAREASDRLESTKAAIGETNKASNLGTIAGRIATAAYHSSLATIHAKDGRTTNAAQESAKAAECCRDAAVLIAELAGN